MKTRREQVFRIKANHLEICNVASSIVLAEYMQEAISNTLNRLRLLNSEGKSFRLT